MRRRSLAVEAAILAGAFLAGTLVAELVGAANLGTALTFGTMALLAAVLALMLLPRER
ncbi:MAG TPA: hypothetical protein VGW75_08165 [Solirubrobacteraceae bacterium]|nr:hypothetical protein [Solirubrobacteraceae bacterium]